MLFGADLLTQADSRSGIEGAEDEWIVDHVFVNTFIKEAIGIKLKG